MRKIAALIAATMSFAMSANICSGQQVDQGVGSQAQVSSEFSVPIRIIPDPHQPVKDRADEEKTERAERREDANLAVQQSVAASSEEMAGYASKMYDLGVQGLVLSIATVGASGLAAWFAAGAVREARSATSVAREALASTQDTAKKQLRAYVVLEGAEIPEGIDDGMLYAVVGLKNFGQTPARITHLGRACVASATLKHWDFADIPLTEYVVVIGPGASIQFHIANTTLAMLGLEADVNRGLMQIGASIRIKYLDIYEDEHEAQFTRTIETARNLHGGLGVSLSFPDSISS